MKDDLKYMVMFLAVLTVIFFAGRCSNPDNSQVEQKLSVMSQKINAAMRELDSRIITGERIDTLSEIVYRIERHHYHYRDTGRIVRMIDTVGNESFVASLDTINGGDTVNVSYHYPANMFDLRLRLRSDSIYYQTIAITKFETKYESRPLWLDVLSHTGSAVFGFGIGYAVGK